MLHLRARGAADRVARDWYKRAMMKVRSLDDLPARCAVDQEYSDLVGHEVRKMAFGDYKIYFRIDQNKATMFLLNFQHGAREPKRFAK